MWQNQFGECSFTGTGCGVDVQERTSLADNFAKTTASPTSLGSIMRSSVLVRPIDQPLSFPLDIHNFHEIEG